MSGSLTAIHPRTPRRPHWAVTAPRCALEGDPSPRPSFLFPGFFLFSYFPFWNVLPFHLNGGGAREWDSCLGTACPLGPSPPPPISLWLPTSPLSVSPALSHCRRQWAGSTPGRVAPSQSLMAPRYFAEQVSPPLPLSHHLAAFSCLRGQQAVRCTSCAWVLPSGC